MEHSTPLLEWHAHIYPHHQRGRAWYITMSTVAGLLLLYSLFTRAWSFTAVLVMTIVTYWHIHREKPVERTMKVYEEGFELDGKFTDWDNCNGFWFLEGPHYHELHIESNKKTLGDYVIQTGEKDVAEIHAVLRRLTTELEDRRERKLDTLARICKI